MLRITGEEYERWRRTLSEFPRSLTLPLKKNVLVEASAWKPSNTLHADESNCNELSCENNRLRHANVAFDRYFTGQMPNIAECSLKSRPCLSQLNIFWYSVSTTAFSPISLFFPVFRHNGRARFVNRMCVSQIEKLLSRKLRLRVPSLFNCDSQRFVVQSILLLVCGHAMGNPNRMLR